MSQRNKITAHRAEAAESSQPMLRTQNTTNPETTERIKTMSDQSKNPASEMLNQGIKNYEQALKTGLKLQEEAGKCWTKMLNQAASPQDMQNQIAALANEVIPATQKSMEGYLGLIEQNSRASVDLLKKSLEAAQTTNYADSQGKVTECWENSIEALTANAQAAFDLNARAIDGWIAFVKKAVA
jgi:translation initiation factor 2 alpha subunit (eIF-2alpha)